MFMETFNTHHSRRAAALDVFCHTVEDTNATADCEQQHSEECADCPDTRRLPATDKPCLVPLLLGVVSAMGVVERYCDISRGQLWLVRSARAGVEGNEQQAGEQQHDAGRVQGLVEGKRVFDGRRSRQVAAC